MSPVYTHGSNLDLSRREAFFPYKKDQQRYGKVSLINWLLRNFIYCITLTFSRIHMTSPNFGKFVREFRSVRWYRKEKKEKLFQNGTIWNSFPNTRSRSRLQPCWTMNKPVTKCYVRIRNACKITYSQLKWDPLQRTNQCPRTQVARYNWTQRGADTNTPTRKLENIKSTWMPTDHSSKIDGTWLTSFFSMLTTHGHMVINYDTKKAS